jgi:beta-phosphoglucomutase
MPALILDFDGVIMDSEPVHERTIRAAAESVGLRLTHEDFVRVCVGTADVECFERLARDQGRELSPDDLARMVQIKRAMFTELRDAGEIRPFPGTVALIRAAAADPRITAMAVCTGSRLADVETQLRAAGLWEFFDARITRESVTRIKPDPEPYARACASLGVEPRDAVALEDTAPGVRSAAAAGLRVAAVCHTLPREALEAAGAHAVFGTTNDIGVDDLLAAARQ